jgi:hypothetical protein
MRHIRIRRECSIWPAFGRPRTRCGSWCHFRNYLARIWLLATVCDVVRWTCSPRHADHPRRRNAARYGLGHYPEQPCTTGASASAPVRRPSVSRLADRITHRGQEPDSCQIIRNMTTSNRHKADLRRGSSSLVAACGRRRRRQGCASSRRGTPRMWWWLTTASQGRPDGSAARS